METKKSPRPISANRKSQVASEEKIISPDIKKESKEQLNSEYEQIKRKREALLKQERINQQRRRVEAVAAKKRKRIFQITTAATVALLLIFAPIFPIQETTTKELDYLRSEDISVSDPLGNYFSPYQFIRYLLQLKSGSEYIEDASLYYNLREMKLNIDISEYRPLVKDIENNVYFYEDGETVKRSDLDIYVPIISGFDQKNLDKLLKSMASLEYDIIIQIDTIEYVGTEEDPQLLKLGMSGDHTVFINMEQMKAKLPYYNQIKQIIDEKSKGKPGTIHLDLGDYYEPK